MLAFNLADFTTPLFLEEVLGVRIALLLARWLVGQIIPVPKKFGEINTHVHDIRSLDEVKTIVYPQLVEPMNDRAST